MRLLCHARTAVADGVGSRQLFCDDDARPTGRRGRRLSFGSRVFFLARAEAAGVDMWERLDRIMRRCIFSR